MSEGSSVTDVSKIALLRDVVGKTTLDVFENLELRTDAIVIRAKNGSDYWTVWQDDAVGEIATATCQLADSELWHAFHGEGAISDLDAMCEEMAKRLSDTLAEREALTEQEVFA